MMAKTRVSKDQEILSFILTLDGSVRSKALFGFLQAHNLNPQLVIGYDGRNKPKSHFKKSRHDFLSWLNFGRRLTNEEIACGLGHLKIYNIAKESELNWFLVCEDDVFPRNGLGYLEIFQAIQELDDAKLEGEQADPSIIHLGPPLLGEVDEDNLNKRYKTISSIVNAPLGTYAYLINSEAINLICKNSKSQHFISTCDWPTQWSKKIQFYRTITPLLLTSDFDTSYIEASRLGTKPKNVIVGKILYRVRLFSRNLGLTDLILKFNGFY